MSTISASTTSTTAYKVTADTTGALVLQTGATPTTALTIDTSQNVGIGTASPQGKLQVFASANDNLIVTGHVNATDGPALKAMDSTATNYKACEVLSAELRLGGTNSVTFGTSGTGGSTERMRIDSSGNVGIGTATPGQKLEVNNGAADVTVLAKATGANYASFRVTNSSRDYSMQIRTDVSNAWVLRDETAGSNRLNVDTSGRVSIGGAGYGPGNSCLDLFAIQGVNNAMNIKPTTNSSYTAIQFFNSSQSGVGAIACTTSATSYGTGSDYRLKENVLPMTGALNKVAQLRPVTFDWISDKTASQGFIAHELQIVVPDAVVGEKDAVDADGNPKYQAIDTSFLVATLTAAIQEQQALIIKLQADVAALKGATA